MTSYDGYPRFEAVEYAFPGPSRHYARVTWPDGRTSHSEPWNSHWAANRYAELWQRGWAMKHRSTVGDGDTCPLFPDHGNMVVLQPVGSAAPQQYCPHVIHDGAGTLADGKRPPPSRAFWPLYGFEESVAAYMARLDRAIREASASELPDLSTLEVHE